MATVRIDGADRQYQEDGAGPPLLLINGSGGGADLRGALSARSPRTMAELDDGTGEHLSTHAIASIRCPVTFLLGDRSDPVFAAATHRLMGLLPQARVVTVAGAGHALNFDRPEEFANSVRSTSAVRP